MVSGVPRVIRRAVVGLAVLTGIVAAAWVVATVRDWMRTTDTAGAFDIPAASEVRAIAETLGIPDSMYGRSGALRFRTLTAAEAIAVPGFLDVLGEKAIHVAAAHAVPVADSTTFHYLVLRPFADKRGEMLNGYRLGRWPAERSIISRSYFNPDGFVEVTAENARIQLTPHIALGDFVTKDQRERWPKYAVLEEKLFDKVELILRELNARGIPTRRVVVLSGFRAPYYNDRGVGEGMARASRHQYGDAIDLIIDDDGNGRMDDLNRDGRVDHGDTQPIAVALSRVERAHPDLRGGLGTYTATGPSGPFVHIDVRGTSARWESGWFRRGQGTRAP
jgi:uncharacterized protein YcbK (DUF882 family)